MDYYVDHAGHEAEFPGVPFPAPGVRVGFDAGKLSATRDRPSGRPATHPPVGDEGLVVYDDPLDMSRWPCRLWQVSDLEGAKRPTPWAKWQRCHAYTVGKELAGCLVLGPHGRVVAAVIEHAKALTGEEVAALAALSAGGEQSATHAVWGRWLAQGRGGSPVGVGLLRLDHAVNDAARRAGQALSGGGEDGDPAFSATLAWQHAKAAAAAAALAFGVPQFASAEERQRLAHRWTTVMGHPYPAEQGSPG